MKSSANWMRSVCSLMILFSIILAPVVTLPQTAGAQSGGGAVRVFFLRDGRIATARRAQTPQDISVFDGALIELLRGPRPDERAAGLSTAFNESIDLTSSVDYDETDKIATVDFGPEILDLGDSQSVLAMAQVVYTLTQFDLIEGVSFRVAGADVPARDGNGDVVNRPVNRTDYEAVTPAIFVDSPAVLTAAGSPIRLRGTANTFEAVFNYALYDADNALLADGFITATSGTGTRGRFSHNIEYLLPEAGRATLIVYEASAKDGSWVNVVAIPLFLRASAPDTGATVSATATQTRAAISSQTATNTPESESTPVPTRTTQPGKTPEPTNTPKPTKTPKPTSTPKPTETPEPTATPRPTEIPTVSLTLKVVDCPSGMGIDDLDPSQCNPVSSGFDFRLSSSQHGIDLRLADAIRAGLGFRWTDLPYGTYLLESLRMPDESQTFFIPRSVSVEGSAGSGYSISLDELSGNLQVTIYILNRWVEIAPF